ncbi:hypothetical protein ACFY8P_23430 [Streptomyces sp. NPDC012693]|uniref:hypothetical protein n=1 Tax=unclassified Streptomyces TaxID=2593676 RepID=UPI00202F5450|nr:hypothetical protein [Streptomyces sp. MSC1_001]
MQLREAPNTTMVLLLLFVTGFAVLSAPVYLVWPPASSLRWASPSSSARCTWPRWPPHSSSDISGPGRVLCQ